MALGGKTEPKAARPSGRKDLSSDMAAPELYLCGALAAVEGRLAMRLQWEKGLKEGLP
jgi:hypothetical protein